MFYLRHVLRCTFEARFTKQGKLAPEHYSKQAQMGVESSTDCVQENSTSHFHNDQQELHK